MHQNLQSIPGTHYANARTEAVASGTATFKEPIFAAPFACRVTRVAVLPQGSVTGSNTVYNLNIQDEGAAGTGDTEIANYDLTTGNDLTAFDVTDIDASLDVTMAADDSLTVEFELNASGTALPAMLWIVEYTPDYSVAP